MNEKHIREILEDAEKNHGIFVDKNDVNIHSLIRYISLRAYGQAWREFKNDEIKMNELGLGKWD